MSYQHQSMEVKSTGVTNQDAEMINAILKSNDVVYNRADTVKRD